MVQALIVGLTCVVASWLAGPTVQPADTPAGGSVSTGFAADLHPSHGTEGCRNPKVRTCVRGAESLHPAPQNPEPLTVHLSRSSGTLELFDWLEEVSERELADFCSDFEPIAACSPEVDARVDA
jgi:hypothetical protein